jgi:septum formation topological specificity factor MinE
MLSSAIIGITAVVILLNKKIDASYAGLAMAFIMSLTGDILFVVRRFVSLEQSMVAVSRSLLLRMSSIEIDGYCNRWRE